MDSETPNPQVVQWLREGGESEAASLLERCDLDVRYVNEFLSFGSDEVTSILDVDVYATRLDLSLARRDQRRLAVQIEKAIRALSEPGTAVSNVVWRGRVRDSRMPADDAASALLTAVDSSTVREAWQKALDRRTSDPAGAITAARTLLESVCKHILDESNITYDESTDLPRLYGLVA